MEHIKEIVGIIKIIKSKGTNEKIATFAMQNV